MSDPERFDGAALRARFLELARTAPSVDDEVSERRAVQEWRLKRIKESGCCITEEDRRNIVRDTLKPTAALSVVRKWSDAIMRPQASETPPTAFLVLIGERGRGKTVAGAWAVANHVIGAYVSGPELTELQVRAKFDSRAAETLVQLRAAGLLVLDDLCRDQHPAKEEQDAVFKLLHPRQRAGYHTIVTTNYDLDVLRERLGDYVGDRLEHAGLHVRLTGPNLRRTETG